MSRIFFKKAGQKPSIFSTLGLIIVVMTILVFVGAGPVMGVIQNDSEIPLKIFELRFKLLDLSQKLLVAGSLLTFLGILHGQLSSRVRTSWRGILAAIFAASIALFMWKIDQAIRNTPILHDITTNIIDPPFFANLKERSYETGGPQNFIGSRLAPNYAATLQTSYPYITPYKSSLSAEKLYQIALKNAQDFGWKIANTDNQARKIEAIYISPWFRLKTNIVVRVREDAADSRLDIRAVSELGLGDFGINAALMQEFKEALDKSILSGK